eukprot:COSAG06_NODE_34737_length_470_cov_0.692722_2_plen_62_part_00
MPEEVVRSRKVKVHYMGLCARAGGWIVIGFNLCLPDPGDPPSPGIELITRRGTHTGGAMDL